MGEVIDIRPLLYDRHIASCMETFSKLHKVGTVDAGKYFSSLPLPVQSDMRRRWMMTRS